MKKLVFNIVFCLLGIVPMVAWAQDDLPQEEILIKTSPLGNYIELATISQRNPETFWDSVERIVVRRKELLPTRRQDKKAFKKVGEAQRISSLSELKSFYSDQLIKEFMDVYDLANPKAVVEYFRTHSSLKDYGLFTLLPETKLALGYSFLDREIEPNKMYQYQVVVILTNKQKILWGEGYIRTDFGNPLLDSVPIEPASTFITDSVISISWTLDKTKIPESMLDLYGYSDSFPLFPDHRLGPQDIRGRVYYYFNGRWNSGPALLPVDDSTGKYFVFQWLKEVNPGDEVYVTIVPEDPYFNQGAGGDTVYLASITEKEVDFIYHLKAEDTLGGIYLHWKELPNEPYYIGIEVARYDELDSLEVIGMLPISDSSYIDYDVEPGINYRYAVRPLFLPYLDVDQEVPALATGSFKRFFDPIPPANLKASSEGADIRLAWDAVPDASIFGYYVYRGISKNSIQLIAGPVKDTTYLDTSASLSGRRSYFYRVASQNYMQDTSEYSNWAFAKPDRPSEVEPPSEIVFYYSNGNLEVRWNDEREDNNFIEKFKLERRIGNGAFEVVSLSDSTFFLENQLEPSLDYFYRVSSVDVHGNESEVSDAFVFTSPENPIVQINSFHVRNVTQGVLIELPKVQRTDVAKYRIYRREIHEEEFEILGELAGNIFDILDQNVKEDHLYVYAVAAIAPNGGEGNPGKEVTIRRRMPNN